ncbi:hypothetical protein CAPTEDRAFT_201390 [Capitella teleta]|uniref:G-protein coupled receptors family 1 profile domain-containing protein n=1 Tax=Capitella teleta TaxID=283909 RepID=R7TQ58_CAPTE|nr:hypothetical protein CAPTEDRAFT_201390 [Capitella teleta]|eukprot:ELT93170.1 hypothetical protein CAPTEDRAFT_201390 [Capitella teleta]
METTASISTSVPPLTKTMTNVQLGLVSASLAVGIITIIINPLTLLALFKQKMITKSSINLFIASLCCSDFLFGIAAFLFQLQKILQLNSTNGDAIVILNCVAGSLAVLGFFLSNANALLITYDRAYAIVAPFEYKSQVSIRKASIALAVAWTSALLQALVPIAINIALAGEAVIVEFPYELLSYSFRLYWVTPVMYIGTATNVLLYAVIVIWYLKTKKKIQSSTSSSELRNRRMTRTVTMVIGTLLIGSIPIVTIAAFSDNPDAPYMWSYRMFYDIATLCTVIPTFFNNFLYVWQLPDYNRAVRRLLSCRTNEIGNLTSDTLGSHTNTQVSKRKD